MVVTIRLPEVPDVALNHPKTLGLREPAGSFHGRVPSNCVNLDGRTMNCVTPTEREPKTPGAIRSTTCVVCSSPMP